MDMAYFMFDSLAWTVGLPYCWRLDLSLICLSLGRSEAPELFLFPWDYGDVVGGENLHPLNPPRSSSPTQVGNDHLRTVASGELYDDGLLVLSWTSAVWLAPSCILGSSHRPILGGRVGVGALPCRI